MIGRVISNHEVAPDIFLLTFHSPAVAAFCQPGNFLMVRVCDGISPLLRRPLSVHDVMGEEVSLLFEVRGEGTRCLSTFRSGQEIDVLGPLGNSFPTVVGGRDVVLVAGGVGIAPFTLLVRRLLELGSPPFVHLFAGGRSIEHIAGLRAFEERGVEIWLATDDGSAGHRGMVSELFGREAPCFQARSHVVFACGPWEMLLTVAREAARVGVECMVSLESRMGCGVGACLGCGVRARASSGGGGTFRYVRVCTEGPVFGALDLLWE